MRATGSARRRHVRVKHLWPPRLWPDTARHVRRGGGIGQDAVLRQGRRKRGVGIEDAASALLLAPEKGRNGERYIVSERFLSACELAETAAAATGSPPPKFGVPLQGDVRDGLLRRSREDGAAA